MGAGGALRGPAAAWPARRASAAVTGRKRPLPTSAADLPARQSACDVVCPMRLWPRNLKRLMFACTQCGQCVAACQTTQAARPAGSLLAWVAGEAARQNEAGFTPPSRRTRG